LHEFFGFQLPSELIVARKGKFTCHFLNNDNSVCNCRMLGGEIKFKYILQDYDSVNVSGAVRRNPLTSRATEAEVEQEMKTWIRNAGDRFGGRSERARRVAKKKKKELRKLHKSSAARQLHSPVQRDRLSSVEPSD
jgi:hypothetical protein